MLFVHLSDIHFKKTEIGQPDDPNLALRSDIIRDVRRMRKEIGRPADGILLTGDIAFAGRAEEYAFAYAWLEEKLCPEAGCKIDDVFVIPGNHDVDRNAEKDIAQSMAREALRGTPAKDVNGYLRQWLRSKLASGVIFGPIQEYNRFAAKFLCLLKPYIDNDGAEDLAARPFARRDLPLNDGSTLRLWGFNTVLVSDVTDAKERMLIDPAAGQIEEEDGVCHMVMAHHPFEWLKNGRDFQDRCERIAQIQLFGHEHTRRVDEGKYFLRIRAGAMHPDRDERDWKPGYNWIDVTVDGADDKRKLVVKVWVRQFETNDFLAIPDRNGKPVWENSYDLPGWKAPKITAETATTEVSAPVLESPTMTTSAPQPPPTIRNVTIKLFKLKEHEQRRVITLLNLDRPGDREMKDYELVVAAVKRSETLGVLSEMDRLIDRTLAGETL
ncbi:metallophosphoesterase [Bradyrhizobium sp. BEA-2-5]|uniref:metallophosphoesterase n=1 Tax=Bradyrhizobium sp. BEA-2-5 TaxID=3080015 RepID=UPI00293EF996|nr:metallophosphoesterase [Bradyrhizobium sp. BEA-2-5]WOH80563.1 metallophosphoesterase [Bradyrhizobium sp. BEA-2-5]